MPWTIYWDNGIDCGTWGHLSFDSEEEAQEYADSVTKEYIAEGIWGEEGSAEPYWLQPPPNPTANSSYYWAIVGRIPFDDEETLLVINLPATQSEAREQFLLHICHKDPINYEAYGGLITAMLRATEPIEIVQ